MLPDELRIFSEVSTSVQSHYRHAQQEVLFTTMHVILQGRDPGNLRRFHLLPTRLKIGYLPGR